MSMVLLMFIIMRRISSLARTSFTRTSSLSARSFTVMPSASVMVRVMATGADGAAGAGADGRSRRGATGREPIGTRRLERRTRSGAAGASRHAGTGAHARLAGADGL